MAFGESVLKWHKDATRWRQRAIYSLDSTYTAEDGLSVNLICMHDCHVV